MRTVLVTGGIGSGKSCVCRCLEGRGVPVYDSDSRAKALYAEDAALCEAVKTEFGRQVGTADGGIDRKALAAVVFGDEKALARLNALVHPAVLADFRRWRAGMEAQGVELVAMESAIALGLPLFRDEFDAVLAVDAPRELRLERACRRDGASREAVQARMDAQNVDLSSADAVIVNDGSEEDLPVRVDAAIAAIGGDIFELYNQVKKDKNMKTDLARILSVSGKHGLYQYVAPSRGGAIAEALSDKTRTAFDAKSRITTLEDIAIYTSEGEMKLREVFLALQSVLGEADAPTSKASADELKDLFGKAVPDYDADRFYVSHMKKVVDWYNELKNFASLDFVNPDEEHAGEETSNE